MRIQLGGLLLCITLLSACGTTPPSNFYMLSADAEGVPGIEGPSVGVGPVTVPEYLKRGQMVLNRDDHRLTLAEYDRWAEPLHDGVRRVVSINLAILLDTQDVQQYPWRRDSPPTFGVQIAVAQFSIQDGNALLVAEWTVSDVAQRKPLVRRIKPYEMAVGGNAPEQIAAGYSALLLKLSEDIAAAIEEQSTGET